MFQKCEILLTFLLHNFLVVNIFYTHMTKRCTKNDRLDYMLIDDEYLLSLLFDLVYRDVANGILHFIYATVNTRRINL